jgi:hypothetical protein
MLDLSYEAANTLVVEALVHEAVGNDYIVSPGLVRARRDRRRQWPNQLGACSVDEAFRLAGVKSRMYRTVPMFAEPTGLANVSVGDAYDLAVTHFTPGLFRALAAVLAPSASAGETAAADHLLAIRSRLAEILVARDAIYRSTRREALGPHWIRPFDMGPVAAGAGNDVIANLAYHYSAALNSAFAVTDNLVWVLAKLDNPGQTLRRDIGLSRLLDQKQPTWASGPACRSGVQAILASEHISFILAARELRNLHMHRDGVNFGSIEWRPAADAPLSGLSGIWVGRRQLPTYDLGYGHIDLFDGLGNVAQLVQPDYAAVTFQRFVDELWRATTDLVGSCLLACPWTSNGWGRTAIRQAPMSGHRWWRSRIQRRLWAMEILG